MTKETLSSWLCVGLAATIAGCTSPLVDDSGDRADVARECELSDLGHAVFEAASDADPESAAIPASHILTFDNTAGPALVDGGEIFPTMAELVAGAERSVLIAMFVWETESNAFDALTDAFIELERRLASEKRHGDPVPVRILINSAPFMDGDGSARALVRAVDALALDPELVQFEIASRSHSFLGAMHHKIAVIDDYSVHIGGANVEAIHDWIDNVPWRDSAYVVHGEIASTLRMDLWSLWETSDQWRCDDSDCVRFDAISLPVGQIRRADGCTPMIALTRWPVGELNNSTDNPQDQGYLAAMDNAQTVIKVQSPNLNDDAAKKALLDAVARGVEVQILMAMDFNETAANLPGQGGGNSQNADELYARALDMVGLDEACDKLRIRWFARPGEGIVVGNVAGAAHLKYMSIDDQMVIVGSANMDTQSWNHSGESNIAIDDPEVTKRYDAKVFDRNYDQSVPTGHCAAFTE